MISEQEILQYKPLLTQVEWGILPGAGKGLTGQTMEKYYMQEIITGIVINRGWTIPEWVEVLF